MFPDPSHSSSKSPSKKPPSSDSSSPVVPKLTTSVAEGGLTDTSPVSNTGSEDGAAAKVSATPPSPDPDAVVVQAPDDASEGSSMGDDWVNLSNTTHPLVASND